MGIRVNTREVERELDTDIFRLRWSNVLLGNLFERGLPEAQRLPGDVHIEVNDNQLSLVAEGDDVAFAEFGTGIYASYPQATHSLRAEPGSWSQSPHGQGQFIPGRKEWWIFGHTWTQGEPPMCAMYNAAQRIEDSIPEVARNYFND